MAVDGFPWREREQRIEILDESGGLAWRGGEDAQHPFVVGEQKLVFGEDQTGAEEDEFLEGEEREVAVLLAERFAVIPAPREELGGEALEALGFFLDGKADDGGEEVFEAVDAGEQNAIPLEGVADGIAAARGDEFQEIEIDVFAVNVAVVGAELAIVVVKATFTLATLIIGGGEDDRDVDVGIGFGETVGDRPAEKEGEDRGVGLKGGGEAFDGLRVVGEHGVAPQCGDVPRAAMLGSVDQYNSRRKGARRGRSKIQRKAKYQTPTVWMPRWAERNQRTKP